MNMFHVHFKEFSTILYICIAFVFVSGKNYCLAVMLFLNRQDNENILSALKNWRLASFVYRMWSKTWQEITRKTFRKRWVREISTVGRVCQTGSFKAWNNDSDKLLLLRKYVCSIV